MQERTPPKQSDAELLEQYRSNGSMPAFATLYKRYAHLVLGMCIKYLKDREEARDATSAVFEKLFKELKITYIRNFPGWLGFVTRNYCISILRKRGTISSSEMELKHLHENDVENESGSRHFEEEANLAALEKAILSLKDDQQLCVKLFYLEEMSYAAIAEKTGMDLHAVKSHLQNGKRNLKLILEKNARIPE